MVSKSIKISNMAPSKGQIANSKICIRRREKKDA